MKATLSPERSANYPLRQIAPGTRIFSFPAKCPRRNTIIVLSQALEYRSLLGDLFILSGVLLPKWGRHLRQIALRRLLIKQVACQLEGVAIQEIALTI